MRPDTFLRYALALAFVLAGTGWLTTATAQQRTASLAEKEALSDRESLALPGQLPVRQSNSSRLNDLLRGGSPATPLFEDFTDGIPADWAVFDNGIGTNNTWIAFTFSDVGPVVRSNFENVDDAGDPSRDWLATPQVTPTTDFSEVSFDVGQLFGGEFGSQLIVQVSTASQTDPADYTTVATFVESDIAVGALETLTVDLSAFVDQAIFVAFLHEQDDGDTFVLDNIRLSGSGGSGFPVLAYSPSQIMGSTDAGGTTMETVTITNDGSADLEYAFPRFAAANRIAELARMGIDVNARRSIEAVDLPKGVDDQSYGPGNAAQYRVGSDAFGYSFIDSNEEGGPTFSFVDISGTGTATGLSDDAVTSPITLPFDFNLYGETFNELIISSNGFLAFDLAAGSNAGNDPIPSVSAPNGGVIAPFWDDLDPGDDSDGGDGGDVYYQDMGDGRFIVQWEMVPRFADTGTGEGDADQPNTFQAILFDNGDVLFQYEDMQAQDLDSGSIGIEDPTGNFGLGVAVNEAYVENGLAISIMAPADIIADVSPAIGTLAPGASDMVTVTLSADMDLSEGLYDAGVLLSTNAPDSVNAIIPVSLDVMGSGGGEQVSLPITFEESIDYELVDFPDDGSGPASTLVTDPEDETNTAVQSVYPAAPACFAGTTVANATGFTEPIPFAEGETTMSVRVWSPEAGVRVRFKVEKFNDPTISVESDEFTTVAGGWETLVYDFTDQVPGTAPINFESEYTKASIFFGFSCGVDPTASGGNTYYWDDITFGVPDMPGADLALNEFRIDQGGADDDEYVEIFGEPGTSLDGLTLLVIGDGGGGQGVIENVTSLDGQAIPDDGYFVAAEGTFTLGTADLTTDLNFENSQSSTYVLVSGFTGMDGDDLDTDDDGIPDVAPWAEVVDAIGIRSTEADDIAYGEALGFEDIGPNGSFPPAQFYRASDTDAWIIGQFDLGVTDTPGEMNPAAPIANVQVIHNAPDPLADVVDVYINGGDMPAIDDLAFRSGTGFLELPAGVNLEIGVAPGSSTGPGDIIASFPAVLPEGDFVVIAEGVLDPSLFEANPSEEDIAFDLNVVPVDVNLALGGASVDLLIHHGIPDAPAVDVVVVDGETVLADGIVFGDAVYLPGIPAADDVVIEVRADADGSVVFAVEADLLQFDGELLSVLASGFLTPDNEPAGAPAAAIVAIPQAGGEGIILPPPAEPGALEFSPSPLVEMLSAGETGTEAVSLINNTDGEITFDFTQYSGNNLVKAPPTSDEPTLELAKGEDDPRGYIQRFGAGGPDAFGYVWIDSNEPGGPAFEEIDISETGIEITGADLGNNENCTFETGNVFDGGFAELDLPFDFSFYGESYGTVSVNTNGWLTFEQPTEVINCYTNDPMPSSDTPNGGLIAPLWDDFEIGGEGPEGGQIFYETLADGRFVIQFDDVQKFSDDTENNTFQVILSPSGAIKYQYVDLNETLFSYTIGIENPDGTIGLEVAMGSDYAANGLAVLITDAPLFVTGVSPATGTIPAGGSVDVNVDFSAEGLIGGTYEGSLNVATSLSDPSDFELPVVLEVTGMAACAITAETLAFGNVIIGNSASENATVMNGGTDSCELTDASADGPFSVEGFTAGALAPGESTTFSVVYTPTEAGDDTGTLTVTLADKDDLTAALEGSALDAPTPEADPDELSFTVQVGEMESGSFTLSNVGGENAADLEFDISVAAARQSGSARQSAQNHARQKGDEAAALGNLRRAADAIRSGASARSRATVDLLSETGLAVPSGEPSVSYAGGGIDCDGEEGIVIQDDGTAENGYSGNPAAADAVGIVDLFTPVDYPATVPNVCVAFITLTGGPSTLDFELVFYDDDGADGAPGTELGSVSATATGIPAIAPGNPIPIVWQTVDAAGAEVVIEEGSVFVGVRYAPPTPINVFLAADQSADRPAGFAGGHFGTSTGGAPIEAWEPLGTVDTFPNYRALFVRPVISVDSAPISVSPEAGTITQGDSEEITVTVDATDVEPGTYEFNLVIATNDPATPTLTVPVTVVVTPIVSTEDDAVPTEFALGQNYPNPFASRTTIDYALPEAARVTITVYDAVGRQVAVLVDKDETTGYHSAEWDTRGLASGVYLYRIQAGDYTKTRKMSIVR